MHAMSMAVPDSVRNDQYRCYHEDPRQRFRGQPGFVVVPRCVEDVALILKLCHDHEVPVIPFGGGTGLVGGQLVISDLPRPVILSTERLNRIRAIDKVASFLTVEAGCTLHDAHLAASQHDLLFPLLLASKGSCQIGGNLATNAGGVNVVRYGNMRDLCLGVEAVFADGSVWHGLTGLRKDNRGYDLRNLLIGSEGSLAIITAACLKVFPIPVERAVFLAAVDHPKAGLDLFQIMRREFGLMLSSFELISRVGIDFLSETQMGFRNPYDPMPDWLVLGDLGSECAVELDEKVISFLNDANEKGVINDALFAQSQAQIDHLWDMRELIPEANRRVGAIASHDISLPIDMIPKFIQDCGHLMASIGDFRINCFGHLGDGNLHYNVFPPAGQMAKDFADVKSMVSETVHRLVRDFGGSTMAEHGVGRIKAAELKSFETPAYMEAITSIKRALDPKGILNPGAVIERYEDG